MTDYSYIDEFRNEISPFELKDNTPYVVLWYVTDDLNGVYIATGSELNTWRTQAQFYPLEPAGYVAGKHFSFDTMDEMMACIMVRNDVKLARALRDLLPIQTTPVFSPECIHSWDSWVSDWKDGKDWRYAWETTWVKQKDEGDFAVFGGDRVYVDYEGDIDMDDAEGGLLRFRRWSEPENDNDRILWYAQHVITKEKVYFCDVTHIFWNTYAEENVCSTRSYSEHYFGYVGEERAQLIRPKHLKDGFVCSGLSSIYVNHECIWRENND